VGPPVEGPPEGARGARAVLPGSPSHVATRAGRPGIVPLAVIALAIFVADQLTKAWALSRLQARPIVIVPDFLDFTLVFNTGVAFGFFSRLPPEWRWLVMVFSLAALVLLCSVAYRIVPQGSAVGRVALGLVFGGAAGNLVDRWRFGAVVDFVHVFWRDWHWPNFNVADSAITIGVVLLATELAFGRHEDAVGPAA
jgi:signal peptidase II